MFGHHLLFDIAHPPTQFEAVDRFGVDEPDCVVPMSQLTISILHAMTR